ncbi:hypothetical protein O5O45_14270 [Hahella aquimaris]|uniref:hypothetical protein n=1 Tax=Hahella sp. HNIBRBA332 TaxID=3015983 RepID=UPI00273C7123|nr:hypothetical protein [Hahella sp. HNIBRBA332]WLQ17082.1 hypothetical protein O5O45_14270 [Hahella sp. HNIBRBA332]
MHAIKDLAPDLRALIVEGLNYPNETGAVSVHSPLMRQGHVGLPLSVAIKVFAPLLTPRLVQDNIRTLSSSVLPETLTTLMSKNRVAIHFPGSPWRSLSLIPCLTGDPTIQLSAQDYPDNYVEYGARVRVYLQTGAQIVNAAQQFACDPDKEFKFPGHNTLNDADIITLYELTCRDDAKPILDLLHPDEAAHRYDRGLASLQQQVRVGRNRTLSTVGRILASRSLSRWFSLEELNRCFNKLFLDTLFTRVALESSFDLPMLAEILTTLAQTYRPHLTISPSFKELETLPDLPRLRKESESELLEFYDQYEAGLFTQRDRYNNHVDILSKTISTITKQANALHLKRFSLTPPTQWHTEVCALGKEYASTRIPVIGGCVVTTHQSEYLEINFPSNKASGLSPIEILLEAGNYRQVMKANMRKEHNAAKQFHNLTQINPSLVTHIEDCNAEVGFPIPLFDSEIANNAAFIGRVTSQPVISPTTGQVILGANKVIRPRHLDQIFAHQVPGIVVRSPLTCQSEAGVCQVCCGESPTHQSWSPLNTNIAALTNITFAHLSKTIKFAAIYLFGGTYRTNRNEPYITTRAETAGRVQFAELDTIINKAENKPVACSYKGTINIRDDAGNSWSSVRIGYGDTLLVQDGEHVAAGDALFKAHHYEQPIIALEDGVAAFHHFIKGANFEESPSFGVEPIHIRILNTGDKDDRTQSPAIIIYSESGEQLSKIPLFPDDSIFITDKATVYKGDKIGARDKQSPDTDHHHCPDKLEYFLTGRASKYAYVQKQIISPVNGRLSFEKVPPTSRYGGSLLHPTITETNGKRHTLEPSYFYSPVLEGAQVSRGDILSDGIPCIHNILKYQGLRAAQRYLLEAIMEVFIQDEIPIRSLYIEVLIKALLSHGKVTDSNNPRFRKGKKYPLAELSQAEAVFYRPVFTGVAPYLAAND